MSEGIGIPFDPDEHEPATLIPGPAPSPPVVDPDPEPEKTPTHTPSPEEPDTGAVPGFDKLALILLVIGLILAGLAFNDFLNWLLRNTVGRVTGGRKVPQLSGEATTQALGSYLGTFAQGFDPEVGTSFTQIATTTGVMSRAYVSLANRILKLSVVVGGLAGQGAALTQGQGALRHHQQVQQAQQQALQQQVRQDGQKAAQQAKDADERLHGLQTYIATQLEPELERLRARIPVLEKGQATTTQRLQDHDQKLGLDAMVGTVAMAMARLGASWTRCDTTRQMGEDACKDSGGLLKALLANALPILAAGDLCGLSVLAMDAVRQLQPLMLEFVDVENALIGCHGYNKPPDWRIAALSPTPVYDAVTL